MKLTTTDTKKFNRIRRAEEDLTQIHGRAPTYGEIAEEANIKSASKVVEVYQAGKKPYSLNYEIYENKSTEFGDIIEDKSLNTETEFDRTNLKGALSNLLCWLDEDDRKVIIHRFGLEGEEPKTLEEISRMFGVTREAVRKDQMRIIKKILSSHFAPLLKAFMDDL
jgi:RNA polymerase sigma factor (sigma-70 family)